VSYIGGVSSPDDPRASLRAEQVAQTRAALVAAGRVLFGHGGYAATSVEDVARQARVTTGALYHHFPGKAALFEAVFEQVHVELLMASAQAAEGLAEGSVEWFAAGFDAFLDKVLEPDVRQIIITDAPAVLGLARFTELDERYAYTAIADGLRAAAAAGGLRADDPETMARLLLGALTRAGMLIASSAEPRATRDAAAASLRSLIGGFAAPS
jgi:AcrR family transcriptional regulator